MLTQHLHLAAGVSTNTSKEAVVPNIRFLDLLYRFRWWMRTVICAYPSVYLPIAARRHPLLVRKDTEIVFEGFFRCGNTFAFEAFKMAQSRPVRTARHIHAPAQVLFAARHGLPVLITLRDPVDCIPSLLLFEPRISAGLALSAYYRYYTRVAPVLDHCVVAPFEQITADFSSVCRRLNHKYGTQFGVFDHSAANVEACMNRLEQLTRGHFGELLEDKTCRPSSGRDRRKMDLAAEAEQDKRLGNLLRQAREAYQACLARYESDMV